MKINLEKFMLCDLRVIIFWANFSHPCRKENFMMFAINMMINIFTSQFIFMAGKVLEMLSWKSFGNVKNVYSDICCHHQQIPRSNQRQDTMSLKNSSEKYKRTVYWKTHRNLNADAYQRDGFRLSEINSKLRKAPDFWAPASLKENIETIPMKSLIHRHGWSKSEKFEISRESQQLKSFKWFSIFSVYWSISSYKK